MPTQKLNSPAANCWRLNSGERHLTQNPQRKSTKRYSICRQNCAKVGPKLGRLKMWKRWKF
eukprot:6470470-Amphidinium_carterae.1